MSPAKTLKDECKDQALNLENVKTIPVKLPLTKTHPLMVTVKDAKIVLAKLLLTKTHPLMVAHPLRPLQPPRKIHPPESRSVYQDSPAMAYSSWLTDPTVTWMSLPIFLCHY